MIDLSKKAASRFRLKWDDLPERSGDHWKVDIMMVGRVPMLLIVHAYTLFTLVRRKPEFKTVESIGDEIRRCCPWYRHAGPVTVGKNSNRNYWKKFNEYKFKPEKLENDLKVCTLPFLKHDVETLISRIKALSLNWVTFEELLELPNLVEDHIPGKHRVTKQSWKEIFAEMGAEDLYIELS